MTLKKSNFVLVLFLLIGLLGGSLVGELLASVQGLSFLAKSTAIRWEPKADLNVFQYDLRFLVKLNLAGILGVIAAFWLYRKI